jgi:uncharacterized protein (TIGR03067 family)
MSTRILLAPFVFLLFAAEDSKEEAVKKDLERLQGTWKMASLEVDGKSVPEEKLKSSTLTIKDDKYIIKVNDQTYETQMVLDPTPKTKTIDMKFLDGANKDKAALGIYKIDGDMFTMCRALSPGQARPQDFGTWPNTNTFLIVWKKQEK